MHLLVLDPRRFTGLLGVATIGSEVLKGPVARLGAAIGEPKSA